MKSLSLFICAATTVVLFARGKNDEDALKDFRRIDILMETGRENEAIVSVSDFLRRYPEHHLADDAQFAMGEIYFRMRDFKRAILEFQKVARNHKSRSDRIAETGLRLGECWKNLNENEKARIEWEAVVRRFENSKAAQEARIHLMGEK
jgi:TolA-binding protein